MRTPAGWRRLQDRLWCPECKRRGFVLRAIALPVSGPSDATWPELRAALHAAFAETTRCANWLMAQIYARDRHRRPGDERLPKMPRIYLYPEARVLFPALASQTLASLERQVQATYRAARLDLVWRHAVSLPTYRYPTPLPLPSRMWDLARHDERWHLAARIGDRRWTLRLRQGPGMRRQMRVLENIAAGTVDAGEATLYEIAAHRGDHRSESACDRRLMVKLAVWLPRREAPGAGEVLIVRTGADAFVTAHLARQDPQRGHERLADQDRVLTLNADHVRRWIAEAARRRQRLREDLAHGHSRVVEANGCGPQARATSTTLVLAEKRLSDRLHRRLHTWTHQAAAQLVACAARRRVAAIAWDATDGGYLPSYPWHRFVTMLTDKAAAAGITVSVMTREQASDGARSATSRPKPEQGPARVPAGTASGNAQRAGDRWA